MTFFIHYFRYCFLIKTSDTARSDGFIPLCGHIFLTKLNFKGSYKTLICLILSVSYLVLTVDCSTQLVWLLTGVMISCCVSICALKEQKTLLPTCSNIYMNCHMSIIGLRKMEKVRFWTIKEYKFREISKDSVFDPFLFRIIG